MPQQKKLSLAKLAGEYGLKTRQAQEAAENVGVNLKRGAAIVAPWQEKLLRPELARMSRVAKQDRVHRVKPVGPIRYEVDDDHSHYLPEGERAMFPNDAMRRLLQPKLDMMLADEERETS